MPPTRIGQKLQSTDSLNWQPLNFNLFLGFQCFNLWTITTLIFSLLALLSSNNFCSWKSQMKTSFGAKTLFQGFFHRNRWNTKSCEIRTQAEPGSALTASISSAQRLCRNLAHSNWRKVTASAFNSTNLVRLHQRAVEQEKQWFSKSEVFWGNVSGQSVPRSQVDEQWEVLQDILTKRSLAAKFLSGYCCELALGKSVVS